MYTLLTLFFISLVGITVMVGRKIVLIKKGQAVIKNDDDFLFDVPNVHEVKNQATKTTKRYAYIALVITLRFYILSVNFLKYRYKTLITHINKIKNKYIKSNKIEAKEQEASKFLKMITEYKRKINRIKERIKEEEGIE